MAKDLEEENRGCDTMMDNLNKRLKECWDRRVDPNKNIEESKKRSLLIQSESMNKTNNTPSDLPPKPPPLSQQARVLGVGII